MNDASLAADAAPPVEHRPSHHRAHVISLEGTPGESVPLPLAFSSPVRPDLIRRAVDSARSHRRQPFGTSPLAGMRHSVEWSGKGHGVARTPRLMNSMRGAQAPNTVSGRRAHPARAATDWSKKINRNERRLAFFGALAATRDAGLARARGHRVPDGLPLPVVLADPVEAVDTTAEARRVLEQVNLWDDVARAQSGVHVRAGRGKRRGRYRREPKSLLVVTSQPGRARGFRNLAGVDIVPVLRLGTEDLAPGGDPGRLTVFTPSALLELKRRVDGGPA